MLFKKLNFNFQRRHYLLGGFIALFAIFISLIIFTIVVALDLKTNFQTAKTHGLEAYTSLKNQDLAGTKNGLNLISEDLKAITTQYRKLSFWQISPFYWHYQDGLKGLEAANAGVEAGHIIVDAIEPYADVIGFKGQGSFVGGTAEDRIVKIMETLDKISPTLDQVIAKIEVIDQAIGAINPRRYPFSISGRSVEDLITQAKSQLDSASTILTDYQPLLTQLPEIAGTKNEKRYLILFQNDAEIRPTGGFWTAYALLKVNKGKVSPEKSDDMYDLDNKFKVNLAPPEIYQQYLNVSRLNLRDFNVSPDFKVATEAFMPYYVDLPGESAVDGIIAINTNVLTSLVKVLGEIDVPGYGKFNTDLDPRCNCPQIIYEVEDIVGRPTPYLRSERKAILGPMMQTILHKAYGAPKQIWPQLFTAIWQNITQKDILFYFPDNTNQTSVERVNLAGRIKPYEADYLAIIDTNLGGAKSNMFITNEVTQEITVSSEGVKKTVTATYKNPFKSSNCNLEAGKLCLNGVLQSWVRFYVPKGSLLLESSGFLPDTVKTSEDLNKTVFEGVYTLAPEAQTKITLSYSVPYYPQSEYRLLWQKQSGVKSILSRVSVNDVVAENQIQTDQELVLSF